MYHGKKASKFKLHVGWQASYEGLRVILIGSVRKKHYMTIQL